METIKSAVVTQAYMAVVGETRRLAAELGLEDRQSIECLFQYVRTKSFRESVQWYIEMKVKVLQTALPTYAAIENEQGIQLKNRVRALPHSTQKLLDELDGEHRSTSQVVWLEVIG